MTQSISVSLSDWPEVIYYMRKEFAALLRKEAEAEIDPRFAKKLYQIAASFEVGGVNIDGISRKGSEKETT